MVDPVCSLLGIGEPFRDEVVECFSSVLQCRLLKKYTLRKD
jgi:hypothetical protein